MLPERCRELLTAYVDGELSARQRRHVLRLLRRSSEARQLLHLLQSDSNAIIRLPRVRPDRDLSEPLLEKIAAQPLRLRPSRRIPGARAFPTWAGVAAAASVLLLVGTSSYCFFAYSLARPSAPAVAVVQNPPNTHADPPAVKPPPALPHDEGHAAGQGLAKNDHPAPPPNSRADDATHPMTPAPTPAAMEKDEPIFTSEGMEMFVELKSVTTPDVPTTFKLHDLTEDAVHKKLVAELQKDSAFQLELPVPNSNRAFERLQAVLKAHHVDLLIDGKARDRLTHPNPTSRTNYVLYTEDLTADELTQLMAQLGADDRKAAEKKPAESLFDALVVRRMTEHDHKELSDLLGVDPMLMQPPKETGPLGVDPRKPVSDQTAAQIAATLAQGKPGAKAGTEHPMLAMPYNPVRPRHDSSEIKLFLDQRKPLRLGALQILLVLRGPTK